MEKILFIIFGFSFVFVLYIIIYGYFNGLIDFNSINVAFVNHINNTLGSFLKNIG